VRHVIRPAARDDIIRQYRYYLVDESVPEVAVRFLEALEDAINALCRMPEIGALRPLRSQALRSLRSWPVRDFEDVRVYYLLQEDLLRVVRVLHGKRDVARILARDLRRGLSR
jgi:toxin ParE1/3/4